MTYRGILPTETQALIVARIDRAKLRVAFPSFDETVSTVSPVAFGIEIRVNESMPEGLMAAVDRDGNMLAVIHLRGDHAPNTPTPDTQ